MKTTRKSKNSAHLKAIESVFRRTASPQPEKPSVLHKALGACRALVSAYSKAEENGCTLRWSDVDAAFELATSALKASKRLTKAKKP